MIIESNQKQLHSARKACILQAELGKAQPPLVFFYSRSFMLFVFVVWIGVLGGGGSFFGDCHVAPDYLVVLVLTMRIATCSLVSSFFVHF